MSDKAKLKNAKNVIETVCVMLEDKNIRYNMDEDGLGLNFFLRGEDIPMALFIDVDEEREILRLYSPIPVEFEGEKRVDAAIATCQANNIIADGCFEFDYRKGRITFRWTMSYIDSLLSKELMEYMLAVASIAVDEYNDKFLMLAKGTLSIKDFFKK